MLKKLMNRNKKNNKKMSVQERDFIRFKLEVL